MGELGGKPAKRSGSNVRGHSINFTARQIASIIRNCKINNVAILEIEGLKLEFNSEPTINEQKEFDEFPYKEPTGKNPFETNEDHPDVQREIKDDPMLEELELQNLMMEDPAEFERVMERKVRDAEDAG